MTAMELAKLVAEMRTIQRKFFGGDRSSATIEHAKRLEKRVDLACRECLEQPGLFDRETED